MNVRDYGSSVLIDVWQGYDGCEPGQYFNIPGTFANILADIVSLTWYLGAAGCSYFEGRGIYFCEYVYGILSNPPTVSTDFRCRISVTMMSRLMLNLRDPKIHTPTLGQMTRGTKTTSKEHVVLSYLHPEILMCSQQTSTKSHQEMWAVQSVCLISVYSHPWSENVFHSIYWDGATATKCGPGSLGKLISSFRTAWCIFLSIFLAGLLLYVIVLIITCELCMGVVGSVLVGRLHIVGHSEIPSEMM